MKKKNSFWINPLLILGVSLFVLTGCPPPVDPPITPTLTTTSVGSITTTSATAGGNITVDGGASVTGRGVCWDTTTEPTITNSKTSDGTGIGSFSSSLTGLNPGMTYFIRAYATNSAGTAYGNEFSFTTTANLSTITTTAITAITSSSATSGGNITIDGGGTITARGVCWSITTGPTISNTKTTDGTGIGSFVSSLTALAPGTKYYVKAYATNSAGTAYGTEISFTTLANLPTVTSSDVTAITAVTATSGGNVTADGGGAITARGVCWSTTTGPTISNTKTTDGTGIGNFTSSLSPLTANTTYFVRAYATNSAGTAYGNEISFKTNLAPTLATVTTSLASNITSSGASLGGNVTSDGNATVTERGVVYATTQNPTTTNNKIVNASGVGSFSSIVTGLSSGTTYYVRAFATNSVGTAYGTQFTFHADGVLFNPNLTYGTLNDIDGNIYKTILIGTQTWMAENLKTTKFNDGSAISSVPNNVDWASLILSQKPGYCWFYNDPVTNKVTYGALYNWFTVNTGKLCPTGWHIPSDNEWITLTNFLGGKSVAYGKLAETGTNHWSPPNAEATNLTGFTAVPGGSRTHGGDYYSLGNHSFWWSSTPMISTTSNAMTWYIESSILKSDYFYMPCGFSVRCIKD